MLEAILNLFAGRGNPGGYVLEEPEKMEETVCTPQAADTAEDIFLRYGNAMFRAAYDILRDDGQAEDAVMDVLEKICASPEKFRGTDETRRKLLVLRTVENAALDRYRKRKRRMAREIPFPDQSDPSPAGGPLEASEENGFRPADGESAEEAYFSREEFLNCDFGMLERAVRQLPEKYRAMILLRYGEEYGNREIAAMLGIPESTVATRLARARDMLKRTIREERL
jgi:RNA polymerase sigma-70 factor (ECF subfamily)